MKKLILASSSPRRNEMLKTLGVKFFTIKSSYSEPDRTEAQSPAEYVKKNALEKAHDIAMQFKNAIIIGADTVVVYRNRVLGKPATMEEAFECLYMLKGRTHAVYTGISVIDTLDNAIVTDYEKTLVTFRELTNSEINFYLSRIDPLDKAGAYAIQAEGAIIVQKIKGCYYNVVGFPIAKLEQMFLKMGISLFKFMH